MGVLAVVQRRPGYGSLPAPRRPQHLPRFDRQLRYGHGLLGARRQLLRRHCVGEVQDGARPERHPGGRGGRRRRRGPHAESGGRPGRGRRRRDTLRGRLLLPAS